MEIRLLNVDRFSTPTSAQASNSSVLELKQNSVLTSNEIHISNIIRSNIPNYSVYFQVVTSHKLLTNTNNTRLVHEEHALSHSLLTYNKCGQVSTFKDRLFKCDSPKQIIFHSIESYELILSSLLLINKQQITYLNFSADNVFFSKHDKPILKGFEFSLLNDNLDESNIIHKIQTMTDFSYKPLEVHLLFYLIMNNANTLSYSLSYEICEHFVNTMPIVPLLSKDLREKMLNDCNVFLRRYINKPKTDIIKDIIKYHSTWDNYSLSVLYLHVFITEVNVFSLKSVFFSKLVGNLLKNISVNPLVRVSLEGTLTNYCELRNAELDWLYVCKLPHSKVQLLQELLVL